MGRQGSMMTAGEKAGERVGNGEGKLNWDAFLTASTACSAPTRPSFPRASLVLGVSTAAGRYELTDGMCVHMGTDPRKQLSTVHMLAPDRDERFISASVESVIRYSSVHRNILLLCRPLRRKLSIANSLRHPKTDGFRRLLKL